MPALNSTVLKSTMLKSKLQRLFCSTALSLRCAALVPGLLFPGLLVADAADCEAALVGPVLSGDGDPAYRPPGLRPVGPGYVDEEYILYCDSPDQAWRTVVNVRRPADLGSQRSRTVIVEPTHPGNIWPVTSTAAAYIEAAGHAAVAASSSAFAVDRLVRPANPERYADLDVPQGDTAESEILARLGTLIKTEGVAGIEASSVILGGYSNTAARVRTYIEQRHDSARMPDGSAIFDGYYPGQTAVGTAPTAIGNLDVPVVEIQGERELIAMFDRHEAGLTYRREDSDSYRLYEVPGMSHIDTSNVGRYTFPPAWCGIEEPAEIPLGYLWGNTLDLLVRWIELGETPPKAERIELQADGRTIARDEFGNARGGYPLVHIQVPVKQYLTVSENEPEFPSARCDMIGPQYYLSPEVLSKRYEDEDAYLSEFDQTLNFLVFEGWYLAPFVDELRGRSRGWAGRAFGQ